MIDEKKTGNTRMVQIQMQIHFEKTTKYNKNNSKSKWNKKKQQQKKNNKKKVRIYENLAFNTYKIIKIN